MTRTKSSKKSTTTSRRATTRSLSKGMENRQSGSPSPIGFRSPQLGNLSLFREDHVTAGSSHEPTRGRESRDLSRYPVTDIRAHIETETRQLGTLPSLTRGTGATKRSTDGNNSQESFDENERYEHDITYGQKDQEKILDELEKEGQIIFQNEDGEPMPSLLRTEMTIDAPEGMKKLMEEGLETEHAVRSEELKKKQEAIENEIAVLESQRQIQMRKAKQVDNFRRKQQEIKDDLTQQQKEVQKKQKELERLRRKITDDQEEDDEDKGKKPDKGKGPAFPKKTYWGSDKDDDNDPDDEGDDDDNEDDSSDQDEDEDDESSHRNNRSHRRYRTPSPNRPSPLHSNLKYPPPQKFDGSPKTPVTNWLFNVELFFDAVGAPDEQCTPYAALLLTGNAQTWWKSLKERGTHPRHWDQFKRMIKEQFYTINEDKKARDALRNLKQTTSVANYIGTFTELTLRINDMSDADIYYDFMTGLRRDIREEMEKRNLPQDLKLLQHQATMYDDLLFNQRSNTFRPDHGRHHFKRDFNRKHWDTRHERRNVHTVEARPDIKDVECYNCNTKGHYKSSCPKPRRKNTFHSKFNSGTRKPTVSFKDTRPGSNSRTVNLITRLKKNDPKVLTPVYATPGSAGADLRPNVSGSIGPFQTVKIPTGLTIEIPKGHCAEIKARSSALLNGIHIDGLIDEDYRNEIYLIVYNRNPFTVDYKKDGKPLAQLKVSPYIQLEFEEVKELEPTSRKGGFGSTDVNIISSRPGKLTYAIGINGKKEETLIDSGADGIYIPERIAKRLGLKTTPMKESFRISVANGAEYTINQEVRDLPYNIQEFKSKMNAYILPGNQDQIILGNSWLDEHNPSIDWRKRTIQINQNGKTITLTVKGDKEENTKSIKFIKAEKNLKIEEGDQVCFITADMNLITHADIDEELGIEPDFYEKDRENVDNPKLKALLEKYSRIFRTYLPPDKPTKRNVEHYIDLLPGTTPKHTHQYRLSPEHQKAIQEAIQELIDRGHIEPSRSPWRSPLLVVIKKDGKLRVVFDFRTLNKYTKGQAYVMKDQYELMEKAAGHKFISTMDLTSGYHQIPMADKCKEMTAFSIPGPAGGQYQFKVMPFGLKGAPATFQQFVDDVFREHLGEFAVIYIDDLAIYSDTEDQHLEHLEKIFKIMDDNDIYANMKKCYFMQKKVPYLGHYISEAGIEMDPKKIIAVKEWPAPKNIKQLRGFLGLTGYYRKFMKNYAKVALPLTKLLKNDTKFEWGEEQENAKQTLITILTEGPILQTPKEGIPLVLHTDASDVAIGAALSQEGKPIAFLSKKFSETEQRWSTYDKELFAVVHAFRIWECYLKNGLTFKHFSDNAAVSNIQNQAVLRPKQGRWIQFLEEFDCESTFLSGLNNVVADALSRKDIYGISIIDNQPWIERIRKLSQKVQRKPWMQEEDGLLYKGHRLYIPGYRDVKMLIIQENHDGTAGHLGFKKTLEKVNRHFYWEKLTQDVKAFVTTCETCQRNKSSTQKPFGTLNPIMPAENKFECYSMDFIGPLPQTKKHGYNGILVIVEMFSKAVTLSPMNFEYDAKDIAEIFFTRIISRFGFPKRIISDRDPRFTGKFWKRLFELVGTKLSLSSAYHPQTDGMTERTNRTLETIIRAQINPSQDDWDEHLPMAEYAINDSPSDTTKFTPFELMYGMNPRKPIDMTDKQSVTPAAEEYVEIIKNQISRARSNIVKAQESQKTQADKHRREHDFKEGDQVYLSTKNLTLSTANRKLSPKWVGPFKIIKRIHKDAFRLDLQGKFRIHPVFHSSLLK